jgi:hypothetical protein
MNCPTQVEHIFGKYGQGEKLELHCFEKNQDKTNDCYQYETALFSSISIGENSNSQAANSTNLECQF